MTPFIKEAIKEFDENDFIRLGFKEIEIIFQRYSTKKKSEAAVKAHKDAIKSFLSAKLESAYALGKEEGDERYFEGGLKEGKKQGRTELAKELVGKVEGMSDESVNLDIYWKKAIPKRHEALAKLKKNTLFAVLELLNKELK